MVRHGKETPADEDEVEQLFDLAFGPGRTTLSSYRLRDAGPPVADLCRVARDESAALAAAIRYWPVAIGDAGAPGLLLGPVAVHPTRQGEGLGALLIGETLAEAQTLGWRRVILIGDAPYYARFGFATAPKGLLRFPPPTNPDRVLTRALAPGGLDDIAGAVLPWAGGSPF